MDMDLIVGIKTEALKVLCDGYDKENGDYPEPLWELCRSFDADVRVPLSGKYVGLQIYTYFKHQKKTRKTANERYWKEGGDC